MKSITILNFLGFNDRRPELGKKVGFAIAQFLPLSESKISAFCRSPLSWSARGWYDAIDPKIFDNLSVVVIRMHQ
jgi:hypothetical protein